MSKKLFSKIFVLLLVVGLLFAVAPTGQAQAADIPVACLGTDDTALLQGAITGANDGDVILVSGTCALTANITVSKDVTLDGRGAAKIQVSGTGDRITMTTAGATLQGFDIEKTDKTGVQNIIYINASNITLANNKIHGQFVIGDSEVSRAFITSGGNTGLSITGNEFWALRQPAYISGVITGTITNNYTHGTKGWVLEQGDLTFTNNTWGTVALGNPNVYDIAILSGVNAAYYTDVPAMSAANNNAFIEDQRYSPARLTPVYVDASAPSCTDCGTARMPYQTIQAGITRVIAGGTVNVAAGIYDVPTTITLDKAISIIGPTTGEAKVIGAGGATNKIFNITSSNVTIQHLTLTLAAAPTATDALIFAPEGTAPGAPKSNINILNNKIYVEPQSGAMGTWFGQAIYLGRLTTSSKVNGNTIYNLRSGLVVAYNSALEIKDNEIYNTKGGIMNYTGTAADAAARVMTNNSWGTVHNEWDIVWNSGGGPYDLDENALVLGISQSNNDAYVVSQMPTAYTTPPQLIYGNRSHVFVNAVTGTETIGNSNGNINLPYKKIQDAIDAVVPGGKVIVAAGTYEGFNTVGKDNITITGAGDAATIIAPTALINTGVGHKYTPSMLASVFVNNSTGITIQGMAIKSTTAAPGSGGADAIVFWNNSTGSIKESIVQGLYTINGAQTGQGIAVDGGTSVLSLINTDISGFNKNAIDVVDGNGGTTPGNLTVNVSGGTITGAGPTAAIAQNGVVYFNQGGGILGGSVTGAHISGFEYTPTTNEATGILAYGLGSGTLTVSGNTFGVSEVSMTDVTGTLDLNAILLANTFPAGSAVVGDSIMIPPTKLYMSPAAMTKDINGGEQVVEIMATDVENMTAYHMEVTFDHTKLQVVSVENGGLLTSTNTTTLVAPGTDLGNTTGRLKFGAYLQAIGGVNYPVTGSGSLVKITFQPIDYGETSFAIDGTLSALYDWPDAFPIPYEVTGDADLNIIGFGPAVSFGYVAYDAVPNGWLRGVSTDFTIVGADLTDATSLEVKLWGGVGGTTLLQTNTANLSGTLFDGFTGFTSPFDIFGNFNYVTDGYWTNVPATEYGQTVAPTCVEATATLAGGTVITKKYCAPLVPGDRSLLLRGTIEPDGGTGQVPGGTPLTITNVNDTVSYLGLIEWYPADESIGRTEGNRVGVEINAPTAFDTIGTTFTVFGNTYTWDVVKDGTNFVWIYPKVTEVPQSWDIVVNWGGNISQTFAVKVLTGSTLNTPPLPTITSTDVTGPYIPGVPREFNFNVSNAGGAYYALATFDYKIAGVSKSDITKFEYFDETGAWRLMGSRPEETYEDCDSGTAICGQFGWAPNGFGPFPADFSGNSKFRITFKNGKTAELPLTLTLKGKKAATDTDWTVLQTFTASIHVYENVTIGGTMPVYYLVGDEGASSFTINNPAGGAPYGNHVEFNLTILNAVKADITSATCTYGPITLDVLDKLSEVDDNLTGTLIGADGAFTVPAPLSASIPCTIKFNTAKQYVTTAEMVYVVGSDKYAVASNTATAVVYPKPVITSSDLPGVFQQGVAKAVTVNVNNVGAMYTPNSFTLHLDLPAGTVVVYGGTSYTCTATGCDIPVTLAAGDNALALTITFNAPSTADIGISLVDPAVDPDRTLATFTVANLVHASIGSVTGTVTMQGRLVYDMAEFTLTGLTGFGPYKSTSNAAGALSFANLVATEYTVTTNMPRFLNITADMAKKITLSANDALNTLWLRGGNAVWTDNVVNLSDANQVGGDWGSVANPDGNVNFDGIVNIQDLALVGGNYGLTSVDAYGTTWVP